MKELIKQYYRFIKVTASKLDPNNTYFDDLVQVGYISLWESQSKWDESKGKQSTFIMRNITFDMMDYLTNNTRVIRIPSNVIHNKENHHKIVSAISINTPIGEDGTIEDLLGNDDEQFNLGHDDAQELKLARLRHYFSKLKDEYQKIILMYQSGDMTFLEIGEHFNQTSENVRVKYFKGLAKLKKYIENN
jgi:RNA polymerase sigma factor (sigma-70 family)